MSFLGLGKKKPKKPKPPKPVGHYSAGVVAKSRARTGAGTGVKRTKRIAKVTPVARVSARKTTTKRKR